MTTSNEAIQAAAASLVARVTSGVQGFTEGDDSVRYNDLASYARLLGVLANEDVAAMIDGSSTSGVRDLTEPAW